MSRSTKITKPELQLFADSADSLSPQLQGKSAYYNLPDSPASNMIMESISAGKSIADMPARKKRVNHDAAMEVFENGQRRQVVLKSKAAEVVVEFADIDKIAGNNKTVKKFLVYGMMKINEQAWSDKQLTRDFISFPLQELVDNGLYKQEQSARRGFKSSADALTSIKVKGKYRDKDGGGSVDSLEVLFTGYSVKNNQCVLYLNPRVNWGFVSKYYTIIPGYYFSLPSNSSDLLYHIAYLARQNTGDIASRGYFTVSMRSVQYWLGLKSEDDTEHPEQLIRRPIETAVAEINSAHVAAIGDKELELKIISHKNCSISDYLDHGYIQVSVRGGLASRFSTINDRTNQIIERKAEKKKRITEKAAAIRMAKGGGDEKN